MRAQLLNQNCNRVAVVKAYAEFLERLDAPAKTQREATPHVEATTAVQRG
jgi:hypothetical protein